MSKLAIHLFKPNADLGSRAGIDRAILSLEPRRQLAGRQSFLFRLVNLKIDVVASHLKVVVCITRTRLTTPF